MSTPNILYLLMQKPMDVYRSLESMEEGYVPGFPLAVYRTKEEAVNFANSIEFEKLFPCDRMEAGDFYVIAVPFGVDFSAFKCFHKL